MEDFDIDWGAGWDTSAACAIANGDDCTACEG